jgi:hypothetical protein
MAECICIEAARSKSFATDGNAIMGNPRDAVLAGCDELARDEKKELWLYRCRTCGSFWAEGLYDHGHVMYEYIFPVQPVGDPVRWLHEDAQELPTH